MISVPSRVLLLAVLSVMAACGAPPSPSPDAGPAGPPWLTDARVLVSGGEAEMDCRTRLCRHNENTDLIAWQGALFLVHRTARSQVLGPNSALLVYRSTDLGRAFTETARLPAPVDRDLRDPHFYVVSGELYIKALTRLPRTTARDSAVDTIAVATHSKDGVTWTPFEPIGPTGWSLWRIREHAGVLYSAAYQDGDLSVALFTSNDGRQWTRGADVYTTSADTPLETELTFLPSGRLLALVRMDGTDAELLGSSGRLRTKVCFAAAPYTSFSCAAELTGQRLDGPLLLPWKDRLYVVARKHLGADGRKRTALFELTGTLDGGPLQIVERGELPSAGDTSYAGFAPLDADRALLSWYSGELAADESWVFGMLHATDIWVATVDFRKLP